MNGNEEINDTSLNLIAKLAEFKAQGHFCDVEICIQNRKFSAHKPVLAACSSYFQAMFLGSMREQYQSTINIHDVSPKVFESLLDFAYGKKLDLNPENVEDILIAADMLQFTHAIDLCASFLISQLDTTNCVGIFCFANQHALKPLHKASWKYIMSHFVPVSCCDEFLKLPFDDLLTLVKCEHIAIDTELNVVSAVIRWLSHDLSDRRRFCVKLFKHIRLTLVPYTELKMHIEKIHDVCLKIALKILVRDAYPDQNLSCSINKSHNFSICEPRQSARKGFYCIGGCVPDRTHRYQWENNAMNSVSYIERYDSFAEKWDLYPISLREARTNLAAVAVNGKIYVLGGEKDSMIYCSIECYDTLRHEWLRDVTSLVTPRCSFQAVSSGEKIYILGGYVGSGVGKSIECLHTENNKCEQVNFSMQTERHSFGAVCFDNVIYMAGGIGLSECELRTVECYDLDRHEWWFARDMQVKRAFFSLIIFKQNIYAIGGHNEIQGTLQSVEVYDPYKNTWRSCGSLRHPRAGAFTAVLNNRIVVIGGKQKKNDSSWNVLSDSEVYDHENDCWDCCENMNFEARCDGVALVI